MLPERVTGLPTRFKYQDPEVVREQPFPITVKIILACYSSYDPIAKISEPVWNSPAGKTSREWLFDNGLINEGHRCTERGHVWLNAMFATPLPASD